MKLGSQKNIVTAVHLFFYNASEEQVSEIADLISGEWDEFGSGWSITKKFEPNLHLTNQEMKELLFSETLIGEMHAKNYGVLYDGCEVDLDFSIGIQ
jgi:hypothetical protein